MIPNLEIYISGFYSNFCWEQNKWRKKRVFKILSLIDKKKKKKWVPSSYLLWWVDFQNTHIYSHNLNLHGKLSLCINKFVNKRNYLLLFCVIIATIRKRFIWHSQLIVSFHVSIIGRCCRYHYQSSTPTVQVTNILPLYSYVIYIHIIIYVTFSVIR